jgi:hypothetical protein
LIHVVNIQTPNRMTSNIVYVVHVNWIESPPVNIGVYTTKVNETNWIYRQGKVILMDEYMFYRFHIA